jgi:hypothetical protein
MSKLTKTPVIKTINVTDVINVTRDMGDSLATMYYSNKDLKVAGLALSGYKTAIGAAKAQIIYKKLTGSPETIEFFENKK